MSELLHEPENASAAIARYRSYGPEVRPVTISPPDMQQMVAACEGQELAPHDLLHFGWLQVEYALKMHETQRLITAKRLDNAAASFRAAITADSTPYVRVQATLAESNMPLLRARVGVDRIANFRATGGKGRQEVSRVPSLMPAYRKRLSEAALDVLFMLEQPLSPDETVLCQTLAMMMLVNNTGNTGNVATTGLVALPNVPRCYEGATDHPRASSFVVWDNLIGLMTELKVGQHAPEDFLPVLPTVVDSPDYSDELGLVRAVFEEITGAPPTAARTDFLDRAHNGLQIALMEHAAREQPQVKRKKKYQVPPRLRLPLLDMPVEFPPQAPMELEGVTTDTIVAWYANQSNGRALTIDEAVKIEKLIGPLDRTEQQAKLAPGEMLALRRLRIECALGLAAQNAATANAHITNAEVSLTHLLPRLQHEGDTVGIFEASLDLLAISYYRAVAVDRTITPEDITENCTELAGILRDLLWERDRLPAGDPACSRLSALVSPALNALLLTSQSEGRYIALPSLPRQRGTTESPGWEITAWPVGGDGSLDISEMARLRLTAKGHEVTLHDAVGLVPLELIGQASHPEQLLLAVAAQLLDDLPEIKKRAKLFKRLAPKASDILQQAAILSLRESRKADIEKIQ